MKKLSLSLLTSLIVFSLMFISSTNAMKYTVDGNTQVAIPFNTSNGITIDRGDGSDIINITTDCGAAVYIDEIHETVYKCEKTYSVGSMGMPQNYTVTINNNNNTRVEIMYLQSSNITSITNFSSFNNLTTVYLQNNKIEKISSSALDGLNGCALHLENNKINDYLASMYKVNSLYLNQNKLKTIPSNIWEDRDFTQIQLSTSISYGDSSNSKYANLTDNEINFVGITAVNDTDTASSRCSSYYGYCDFENQTSYNFEWFGYSYNTSPLTYDYKIEGTNISVTGYSSTGVTINQALDQGSYTFKVCIHDSTEYCDTFNFNVSYDEDVTFTNSTYPDDGDTISSIDGIKFYWEKSGNYPEQFLSGYTYTLKKGSTTIINQTTPVSLSSTSYILATSSLPNDPNGTYTFTVNLVNQNGTVASATRTFEITIDDTITIEKPESSYDGTGVTTVSVPLKWSTSSSLFTQWSYYITTNNTCSSTNIVKSGNNITNNPFQDNVNLGDGNYLLCVTMHASNGSSTSEKSFSVNIPSTIQITSPTNGADITTAQTTFSWNGFTPYNLTNYSYELLDEHSNPIIQGTTGATSFSRMNLPDGDYTFRVTLNDDSGKTPVSDSVTFTVSSSAGRYVNIIRPTAGNHTGENVTGVNINFYWEGSGSTLFDHYKYTLKQGSTIVTSGTTNSIQSGSFERELPSGTYTFYVDMLDSDNHSIVSGYRNFNVIIPTTLSISKPTPGLQSSKDIEFNWTGFAEFFSYYQYTLSGWNGSTLYTGGTGGKNDNYFQINNLHHGEYRFTVNIISTTGQIITGKFVDFGILDDIGLAANIYQDESTPITNNTIKSRTGTFSWYGQSEDFSGYYYSISGTTFTGAEYAYTGTQFGNTSGNVILNDLSSGKYRFTLKMLSGPNIDTDVITGKSMDFEVAIPPTLTIISPASGSKIESSSATFSWTGYNDVKPVYGYTIQKGSTVLDTNNLINENSFTLNNLTDGSYTFTVYMFSGGIIASDTVNFTVAIPVKTSGGGGSSGKSHKTNDLKLSIGNDSPATNEWIELIVSINEKYTGKVKFTKLQYYSGNTEKRDDIPLVSKNFISDYSDDAKLGYISFSSNDSGKKQLSQFIKFLKNGHYRIYAEDKDGYDTYVQFQIGAKKEVHQKEVHQAAPEIIDDEEEVYIARSCKKYTIRYSESLGIYTSPNLNMSEYFMNKDYFKRYIDSKNRRQSGCPTNVGRISTSWMDKTDDNDRYTAPNGKVYFITGQGGNYYSDELNKELKTPTSFRSIQELKYYIRDRNPLINMATLGPVN